MVFATYGGRSYARAWPRKVGPSPLPYQQETVQRFIDANRLAKIAAPQQIIEAMKATKNTGLYPRDLLTKAMLTGLFNIVTEDGQTITRAPLQYEVPVFLGARIYRTANQPLNAGITHILTWQAAELNAIGMWDISDPTLFTIPTGVTVVQCTAQIRSDTGVNSYLQLNLRRNSDGRSVAQAAQSGNFAKRVNFPSGPFAVSGGEQYRLEAFSTINQTLIGGQGDLWFSIEVLG